MSDSDTQASTRHKFHICDFKSNGSKGGPVPVGPKECISLATERHMTTAELFAFLSRHEAGDKTGTALIPAHFDVSGGPVQRLKHAVTGAPALLCLDSDSLLEPQAEQIFSWLHRENLTHCVYSSHSNGKAEADGRVFTKFRLIVELDRELAAGEIENVRLGGMRYIAGSLGLPLQRGKGSTSAFDLSAKEPNRLLYLPRYSKARAGDVFNWSHFGVSLSADRLAMYARTHEESLQRVKAEPRPLGDWPNEVLTAASEELERFVYRVTCSDGNSFREIQKRHLTILGGFVGLGLLDEVTVLDEYEKALLRRAAAFPGQDDQTVAYRFEEGERFLQWGKSSPLLPRGFGADGRSTNPAASAAEMRPGLQRVKTALVENQVSKELTIEDAQRFLKNLFSEPLPTSNSIVHVVQVTTGAGKSHAMISHTVERAAQGLMTVIASNEHGLLGQIRRDLEAKGVKVFHYAGTEAPAEKTGRPECVRLANKEAHVVRLKMAGASIARTVCPTCPHAPTCEARKNAGADIWDSEALVAVLPYAALPKLADWGMPHDTMYMFDEQPGYTGQISISLTDIRALSSSHLWMRANPSFKRAMFELINCLVSDLEPSADLLEALGRFRGRPHWEHCSAGDLVTYKRERALVSNLLAAADALQAGANRVRSVDDDLLIVDTVSSTYEFLRHNNVYVFSATPDLDFFQGLPFELHRIDVKDFHATLRLMYYTSMCSRRQVYPGGSINVELLKKDLDRVLRLLPPQCKRVLLSSYKIVVEALQGDLKHLLADSPLEFIYPEASMGRNDWCGVDAVISMYEPLKPPRLNDDGTPNWSGSVRHAASLIAQVQARGRDVQPRIFPVFHLHLGNIVPVGWHASNCLLIAPSDMGRNPLTEDHCKAIHALQMRLGKAAAAQVLGVSERNIQRWLKGTCPSQAQLEKLDERLATILVEVDPA